MFDSSFQYICFTNELTTHSASIAASSWRTKPLNTLRMDETGLASLSSNQMTIPSGVYLVRAIGTTHNGQYSTMRLFNMTDGVVIGHSGQIYTQQSYETFHMTIDKKFEIQESKILELQVCLQIAATYGCGVGANVPNPYIYTMVEFFRYL